MNSEIEAQFQRVVRLVAVELTAALVTAFVIAALLPGGSFSLASEAKPTYLLYPVFAMVLLVVAVATWMGISRVGSIRGETMDIRFYRTFDKGEEPERLRVITRQLINLFEMPVLFYVVVILTYVTVNVTGFLVGLAWAYVLFRYVHCWVHLTNNDVSVRLSAWATSNLVLLVMWTALFAQLLA